MSATGREAAIGRKRAPGPLYGLKADLWAALAVAVTWAERPAVGGSQREGSAAPDIPELAEAGGRQPARPPGPGMDSAASSPHPEVTP